MRYYQHGAVARRQPKPLLVFAAVGAAIVLATSFISQTFAATAVVTPSAMNGWYVVPTTGGTTEFVTSAGALGAGAAEFKTLTNDDYTRLKKDVSHTLSSITTLSYMTKQISAPTGAEGYAAVSLRLYVDLNNDGIYDIDNGDDVLVFEPYYTGTVYPGWQTWDALNGYWWSGMEMTYNGHHSVGAGGYDTNFKLSDVVHDYPDATVKVLGLGTGSWNAPWTVQADALTVNSNTYDFERFTPVSMLTSKDQCKNDGWKNFDLGDNKPFKNQGACVSYVVANPNANFKRN